MTIFTELIKNIGVKGVQVDEIIDLDILESDSEPVYGLIFLLIPCLKLKIVLYYSIFLLNEI